MEIAQRVEALNVDFEEDDELQEVSNMISSTHESVQLEGLVGIQRIFSENNHHITIQRVIHLGIVPKILEFTTFEGKLQFQLESTGCMTTFCGLDESFSDYIIQLGGIDILIYLLDSDFDIIIHQAMEAISNLAYSGTSSRDKCLEKGCLNTILQLLKKFENSPNMRESAFHTIYSLTRGNPCPDWNKIAPVLPMFYQEISEVSSQEILSETLWSLSYICAKNVQEVLDQGCLPFLVQHLQNASPDIFLPALITLGHFVSGSLSQRNKVLELVEFLPRVFELALHPNESGRRNSFWVLKSLTSGGSEHFETILKNQDYITNLKLLVSAESEEVRNLAALLIYNMISQATPEQINLIVKEHNIIEVFAHLLTKTSPEMIKVSLKAILSILFAGGDILENQYAGLIREANLIDIIKESACNNRYITLLILDYLYQ